MTPTMLEDLYNASTTWIIVTPSTLPATTFSADASLGVNTLQFINTSETTKTVAEFVENLSSNAGRRLLASTQSGYSYVSSSPLATTLGGMHSIQLCVIM